MKDPNRPTLKEYVKNMGTGQKVLFIILLIYIVGRIAYFALK